MGTMLFVFLVVLKREGGKLWTYLRETTRVKRTICFSQWIEEYRKLFRYFRKTIAERCDVSKKLFTYLRKEGKPGTREKVFLCFRKLLLELCRYFRKTTRGCLLHISRERTQRCTVDVSERDTREAMYMFQEGSRRVYTYLRKTKGYALYVSQRRYQMLCTYLRESLRMLCTYFRRKYWLFFPCFRETTKERGGKMLFTYFRKREKPERGVSYSHIAGKMQDALYLCQGKNPGVLFPYFRERRLGVLYTYLRKHSRCCVLISGHPPLTFSTPVGRIHPGVREPTPPSPHSREAQSSGRTSGGWLRDCFPFPIIMREVFS